MKTGHAGIELLATGRYRASFGSGAARVSRVFRTLDAAIGYRASLDPNTCRPRFVTARAGVYFVQVAAEERPIKIGHARNILVRFRALQSAIPWSLSFLGYIPGDLETEATLHERFAAAHLRGEWFRPSVELLTFIRENRA